MLQGGRVCAPQIVGAGGEGVDGVILEAPLPMGLHKRFLLQNNRVQKSMLHTSLGAGGESKLLEGWGCKAVTVAPVGD